MFAHPTLIPPVLALIAWSLIVWAWMIGTRIPAMTKLRIHPQKAAHTAELTQLPSSVRAISDNYNHLMEQPTLFYALAFATYLAGHQDGISVGLAWGYVALRIVHSLVQNLGNRVTIRFYLFVAYTALLIVWTGREALALLNG